MNIPKFIEFNSIEAKEWVENEMSKNEDFIDELTFKFQKATVAVQRKSTTESVADMANILLLMTVISET